MMVHSCKHGKNENPWSERGRSSCHMSLCQDIYSVMLNARLFFLFCTPPSSQEQVWQCKWGQCVSPSSVCFDCLYAYESMHLALWTALCLLYCREFSGEQGTSSSSNLARLWAYEKTIKFYEASTGKNVSGICWGLYKLYSFLYLSCSTWFYKLLWVDGLTHEKAVWCLFLSFPFVGQHI